MREKAQQHFEETGERIYRSKPQDVIFGTKDPGNEFDLDYTDEQDSAFADAVSSRVPIDKFDEFVNAVGAIKKG